MCGHSFPSPFGSFENVEDQSRDEGKFSDTDGLYQNATDIRAVEEQMASPVQAQVHSRDHDRRAFS